MARRKRVTIKQVAGEAGVSTQTVSRVINNRPDVAPATRREVQQIIDRLGYRPSQAARSLSRGRSFSLGAVAYGIEYFGPSRTLSGIERQAAELGYSSLLYLVREPESDNVTKILADLLSRHVDGVIWAVPQIGDNRSWLTEQSFQLPLPMVFPSMEPHPELSVVCVDNYRGGQIATRHLLDQGYEDIGLITGPIEWWEARERERGWRDTLVNAGKQLDQSLVVHGNWSAASGEMGLNQLLDRHPDLQAVFAGNDQMALGALMAARKRGHQVPDDLAIVGFDDLPESAYFCPPLTTVGQPLYEMGCASVVELHRLIDAGRREDIAIEARTKILLPELVVRESSVGR
jgi:LacI family transcriptional regulator